MATTWGRRRVRASRSPSRLDVIIGWKSWAAATSATSLRKRSTPVGSVAQRDVLHEVAERVRVAGDERRA